MKKQILIAVAFVMAMLICAPTMAQTRKDKKAANKAEWEAEQKRKSEEAALLHQMKMDSIRNAKAAQDAKAKAEQEAASRASYRSNTHQTPCFMADDDEWFYATTARQFKISSINTAATALLRSAQLHMRQKLSSVYKAVLRDYFDQMDTDEGQYANSHIESAGDLVVKSAISETYEVCRESTDPDANGMVYMYMTIKVSKKKMLDTMVKEITKDKEMAVRFNEKKLREEASKVFQDSNNAEYNQYLEENK